MNASHHVSGILASSCLHWQPIVCIQSGQVIGAEALLRSPHGTPGDVLKEIARTGEWKTFTLWSMEQVRRDSRRLSSSQENFLAFFNLSPGQCVSSWILPALTALPDFILPVIEVTEEALNTEQRMALQEIRSHSRTLIAIDDFGTGHSNIDRLIEIPAEFVKLDRKLLQAAGAGEQRLVEGVVRAIGKNERMILGEGIENEAQLRFAQKIGCVSGQGWFYGKPAPVRKTCYR